MVTHSRAPTRSDQLRPLELPRPIDVAVDGQPVALVHGNRRSRIAAVQDEWRIDDEWWRAPIARHYCQIALETGVVRTIYHDLVEDVWYEQTY